MLEKLRTPAIFVAVLGAAKLILEAFGYNIITDDQINSISNGLAAIFTVAGIAISPKKAE